MTDATPTKRRGRPPKVAIALSAEDRVKAGFPAEPTIQKGIKIPSIKLSTTPTPTKTTGQWLMALRKLIQDTTGKPWPSIAMLNPTMDGPYDPFVLKARLPSGNQWVGEYSPHDITDADLPGMVADLLAVREEGQRETEPQFDEEGEPLSNPKVVGKVVKVAGYEVIAKDRTPKESITQEADRIERESQAATRVQLFHEGNPQFVSWNGHDCWITEGMNDVPAPIAHIYWQSKVGDRGGVPIDLDARLAAGLPQIPTYNELNGFIAKQVVPGRRG